MPVHPDDITDMPRNNGASVRRKNAFRRDSERAKAILPFVGEARHESIVGDPAVLVRPSNLLIIERLPVRRSPAIPLLECQTQLSVFEEVPNGWDQTTVLPAPDDQSGKNVCPLCCLVRRETAGNRWSQPITR